MNFYFPSPTLFRASLRYMLRHPWQLAMSFLGIALGVAVVVAIDIASASADRAFALSAEQLSGRATHEIVADNGLDEQLYFALRRDFGLRNVAPILEGTITIPNTNVASIRLQVMGIDLLADGPFNRNTSSDGQRIDMQAMLTQAGSGLLSKTLADELAVKEGETIGVEIDGKATQLFVAGLLQSRDDASEQALKNFLMVDIATAQEWFQAEGRLSRIQLILPEDSSTETILTQIRALLPDNARIETLQSRNTALAQMTRAFRLNLTAMSLLALVVGSFIIFNAMTFSVLRRRALFGTLRALGNTRSEIGLLVLTEALVLGFTGAIAGWLLGLLISKGLLSLVTRTINDLYFVLEVQQLHIGWQQFFIALGLGIGASLVAAFFPALEATRTQARVAMLRIELEQRVKGWMKWLAIVGVIFMACAWLIVELPGQSLIIGFVGMFVFLLGYALLSPLLILKLCRVSQSSVKRIGGFTGNLAIRNVYTSFSRTGIAIIALMIAMATAVGVSVMISSFRVAVDQWLSYSLQADMYVTTVKGSINNKTPVIENKLATQVAAIQNVDVISRGQRIKLQQDGKDLNLLVLDVPERGFKGYQYKEGDTQSAWPVFESGQAVLISEPYAYRHNIKLGDILTLPGKNNDISFPVAGVYYDYSSERGIVVLSHKAFNAAGYDFQPTTLGVYINEGKPFNAVRTQLQQIIGNDNLLIRESKAIHEASLAVFDRTFTITQVLRLLTIIVAVVGVFSALMALHLERTKDFAVMRATGLTVAELRRIVLLESGIIGIISGVLAIPLGLLLARFLISEINQRSFGWSMAYHLDYSHIVLALLLAVGSALVAGIYPARKLASTLPAAALRND